MSGQRSSGIQISRGATGGHGFENGYWFVIKHRVAPKRYLRSAVGRFKSSGTLSRVYRKHFTAAGINVSLGRGVGRSGHVGWASNLARRGTPMYDQKGRETALQRRYAEGAPRLGGTGGSTDYAVTGGDRNDPNTVKVKAWLERRGAGSGK